MATIVLVHGAGGGGWGWQSFASLLRSRGHRVYTPSMTGYGDRGHLSGKHVDVSLHVQDVCNLIDMEGLQEVMLVGHSYGGLVGAAVADKMPERISHLVLVDALLPRDGESARDIGDSVRATNMLPPVVDGWKIPMQFPPARTSAEEERNRRLRPIPIGTFEEKVRYSQPLESRPFTRTYIKALHPGDPRGTGNFWRAADEVRANPAWRYYEMSAGHGVHRDLPNSVVGVLMDLIKGS